MDKKTKDCAFATGLILFGGYVVYESLGIVARAAKPPYNIKELGISPGLLPMVLGCALIVFSLVLLLVTLHGGERGKGFFARLAEAGAGMVAATRDPGVRKMALGMAIMGIYSFFGLGTIPFWIGGIIFLLVLMTVLRSAKWWVIVLSSGISVALIVLLFQVAFKTSLP